MDKQIIYDEILAKARTVMEKQRVNRVYPHDLLQWLPFTCSVWTVRRYMRQMVAANLLIRNSRRGGYRLPVAA